MDSSEVHLQNTRVFSSFSGRFAFSTRDYADRMAKTKRVEPSPPASAEKEMTRTPGRQRGTIGFIAAGTGARTRPSSFRSNNQKVSRK